MQARSKRVISAQTEAHPQLHDVVRRHLVSRWRAPLHRPSVDAFEAVSRLLAGENASRRRVLDSGCGTGESTRRMARRWPDYLVLGVDRSAHRLRRTGHEAFPAREGNIIWVRADLATFWRLALASRWRLEHHFLLYPNPSPRRAHLRRRWHAHPAFPVLLALGGMLELRSNWSVYVDEFAVALEAACGIRAEPAALSVNEPISAFERKYQRSNHNLFCLRTDLDAGSRVQLA